MKKGNGSIIAIFVVALVFCLSIWGIRLYNTPENIRARAEAQEQQHRRAVELIEARAKLEEAKSPEQRQAEANAQAMDAQTMSVGEYVGAKVIMGLLGF